MRTIKNFHLSCVVRKELYGLYEEEESSTGVFDFFFKNQDSVEKGLLSQTYR